MKLALICLFAVPIVASALMYFGAKVFLWILTRATKEGA